MGDVVQAHCYVAQHRQTDCEQRCSRIDRQLIFVSYIQSCMQLTKAYIATMSCNQLLLHSAMSLLMHQLPIFIICALIVRTLVMAKSK